MNGRMPGMTLDRGVRDERADDAGRAGDDVEQQRAAAAVAGGEQDRDVADFLRNLVRGDGDGRVRCRAAPTSAPPCR
mgnify:CR=1 FL=1